MKKTLIITRHAHTHNALPGQEDHDRELTSEGRAAARKTALWLKEQGIVPSRIVASSAKRTQATAAAFAEVLLNNSGCFETENALFRADDAGLLEFLQENFTGQASILLVGHNPAVTQFAIRMGANSVSYLPPASAVVLSVELANWQDLRFHGAKLVACHLPDEN